KLGVFHLGKNHGCPIEELVCALDETAGTAAGSLIVLPEAFNLGRPYYQQCRAEPKFEEEQAKRILKTLAEGYKVSFVAGLLKFPHNSAFLIEAHGEPLLMWRKMSKDGFGNYEQWTGDQPAQVDRDGFSLVALICNDMSQTRAEPEACRDARARQLTKLNPSHTPVVCVPAARTTECNMFSQEMEGRQYVFANSDFRCRSFITDTHRQKIVEVEPKAARGNVVYTWPAGP
ncbi:MAG: hypothetical protein Q8Q12_22360, partial [bacterium]|nr:hypothetical protein [bacterium]